MKKLACLLLIVLLFSVSSCKKKIQNDFSFKSSEEIMTNLNKYDVSFTLNNETYLISRNENGIIFCKLLENNAHGFYTLYDAAMHKEYLVNDTTRIKQLCKENSQFQLEIYNLIQDLVCSHLKITKDFKLTNDSFLFINRNTSIYELKQDLEGTKNIEKYIVDNETGACLSFEKTISEPNQTELATVKWEFINFSLTPSNLIDEFLLYEDGNVDGKYNVWPDTELGRLIPEMNNGQFIDAYEDDESLTINIKNVSYNQVKAYIDSFYFNCENVTKFSHPLYKQDRLEVIDYYDYFGTTLLNIKWSIGGDKKVQIIIKLNQEQEINKLWKN